MATLPDWPSLVYSSICPRVFTVLVEYPMLCIEASPCCTSGKEAEAVVTLRALWKDMMALECGSNLRHSLGLLLPWLRSLSRIDSFITAGGQDIDHKVG